MKTIVHRNENKRAFLVLVFALFLWVAKGRAEDRVDTIKLDWAYYNPVSLVLKEKSWPEEEFKKDGIKIEWTQSLGSNKALELLRSKGVDFGSTARGCRIVGQSERQSDQSHLRLLQS